MFNRRIFSLIQIIASIAFLIMMIRSGLFPVKYIIIFIIIFVVLVILFDKMMKPKKVLVAAPRHARGYKKVKKNGKRQLVGRVLTLLVSIFLFVGCFYVHTGSSTIATLTSSDNTITTRYNLYTLKSKGYLTSIRRAKRCRRKSAIRLRLLRLTSKWKMLSITAK